MGNRLNVQSLFQFRYLPSNFMEVYLKLKKLQKKLSYPLRHGEDILDNFLPLIKDFQKLFCSLDIC